ncbi:MAG: SDR family oxidoreductase [Actinomycetota bacterium]|nr:SDR family oxidoreductase [Actinomycetota bacterium]
MRVSSYLETLFGLRGRVALVTGGTSGIGLGVAEGLGRAGASVVLAARGVADSAAAVTRLHALGVTAAFAGVDLADRDDVDRLCSEGTDPFGEIDILVNCAGVNIRRPMAELTDDDHATLMAVNATAPYRLGQHFGPRMAERGWGRILNVGSQQSVSAFGNSGAYGVSKAAVAGLSRSQAEAWSASGVCSNTLVPGFVVTPMTAAAVAEPGREQVLAARSMTGRNGVPADFAAAAVFLCSEAAAYVTGTTLFVDGGFSVH